MIAGRSSLSYGGYLPHSCNTDAEAHMSQLILGIDPGSRVTGYAVLEERDNKLHALRCDVIRLAHLDDHSDRLQKLFDDISRIATSIKPASCAVETPVYGQDPMAMLKLGRAQAACILAITNSGFPVMEYYPKEVKKSITGNGNASKEQVAFMLRKMVTIEEAKLPNDATDALAVAWCHMMKGSGIAGTLNNGPKQTHKNNKKSSWQQFIDENPERVRKP